MQVCSVSRELRFFVNGVDQGVAFTDLPLDTPLYGAASLYKKDSQIVYNVRGNVYLHVHRWADTDIFLFVLVAGFVRYVADITRAQRQTNFNQRHHGHQIRDIVGIWYSRSL